jgi:hypothetical protein
MSEGVSSVSIEEACSDGLRASHAPIRLDVV